MAGALQIEYCGALYHVISRGNEKRPIVTDDKDRAQRIDGLRRTVQTYGWNLHAFVLMTNHGHLFVETPDADLSAGMRENCIEATEKRSEQSKGRCVNIAGKKIANY